MPRMWIEGLQRAQDANLRTIEAMQPHGAYGRLVRRVTVTAQAEAVRLIHVETGAYKAAQRIDVRGVEGQVFTDPQATNPYGGRPAQYGPVEEARGGSHAAYRRTAEDAGPRIVGDALSEFIGAFR